ncbi:hypothetical protein VEE57_42670 [Escherichia coli]|nr:hypothetical protein VEE57_42670 [Escherichia coli]
MFAEYGVLNYWTYLVGAIFIVLVPGPNTLFVLKNSVSSGMKERLSCGLRCIYWRCGIDVSGMGWSGDIN